MRIEVRTCNQVRIMLEMSSVKSQRRIINGEHCHCQVLLSNGKTLDLETPIQGIPLEVDIDIAKKKNKFLTRLTHRIDGNNEGELTNGKSI